MAPDGRTLTLERKDAALLALVAVEGPQARSHAAALLWPDVDTVKARRNLRQRLFRLHRRSGAALLDTADPVAFTAALRADLQQAAAALQADPAACAGELLGQHSYDDCAELAAWVDGARARWRTRRSELLTAHAAALESAGALAAALAYAERLVHEDPLREHGHRLCMRLHYLRGDRAAALAAYVRCAGLLRQELGAAPAPETRDLAALVRQGTAPGGAPAPPATGLRRPPRLVGRQAAWRGVQAAWQAAGVLLLRGELGLGKSRLVGDFVQALPSAAGRVPVIEARAGDADVPHALLARCLRALLADTATAGALPEPARAELARLLPELGPSPPGPWVEARFSLALGDALACAAASGVGGVVLEDLHFADAASLERLPQLTAALPRPCLMTLRPGQPPPALLAWLRNDAGARVTVLDLMPLGPADIRRLLDSLALPGLDARAAAALAVPLHRHTGGNPLFVLETLRLWLSQPGRARLPVPPAVERLIEQRLHQLSPPALRLARVAALAGADFSATLAAEVLAAPAVDLSEPWLELEAAEVLQGERFAHDLVQAAARRSVARPVARVLHGAIASALARNGAAPARVAAQHAAAHEWDRAGRAWLAAAEAARAQSRHGEQAQALQQAEQSFARAANAGQRLQVLALWFDCALHVDALSTARQIARRMRRLARSDAERAEAAIAAATLHNLGWNGRLARAPAAEAVRLSADSPDLGLRLRAVQQLATAEAAAGRPAQALAGLQPWLPRLEEAAVAPAVACGLLSCHAHVLEVADRRREAIAAYEATVARALAEQQHAIAHAALTDQAVAMYYLGELEPSATAYERARRLRDRIGGGKGWSRLDDMALGGHYRELGRFAEALALLEPAAQALRAEGYGAWAVSAEHELAATWIALGQPARAMQALGALPADSADWVRCSRLVTEAGIARALGRPAGERLAQALALLARGFGRSYLRLRVETEAMADAAPDAACRRLAEIRAETERRQQFGLLRLVAVKQVDAWLRAGRVKEAGARAAADLALFEAQAPVVVYAPLAWWTLHRAFEAAGQRRRAAHALSQATRWIRQQALPRVPAPYQDSFLHRNPVNRAVLAAARGALPALGRAA